MRLVHSIALLTMVLGVPIPAVARSATPAVMSPVPDSDDFAGLEGV
jgi:hypothetical protein